MRCPYLKEARVKYCDRAALRKMIRLPGDVERETCSSPRYTDCSVYQGYADGSQEGHCPYLRESLTQYCAAASVTRFIPFSDSLMSRCGNDGFHYCDTYLPLAHADAQPANAGRQASVAGIPMPDRLYYSANHLWLDLAGDGSCHLGIDAFLARVLGTVERITFLTEPGVHQPCAVVTARGMDLQLVFPNAMLLTASNLYLRANPAKLTVSPYDAGWLFEGVQLPGQSPLTSGLIRGDFVAPWIESEIAHMSDYLAECRSSQHGQRSLNDGGVFSADVLTCLSREQALRLFHEFFSRLRM
jgi:glycine cleavage system H lipoate-binding protein